MQFSDLKDKILGREELGEGQQNRRLLIGAALKLLFLFLIGIALIYSVVSIIFNVSLTTPGTAKGILLSAKQQERSDYAWVSESKRRVSFLNETPIWQNGWRRAVVNLKRNRFESIVYGVLENPARIISDGKYSVYFDGSNSENPEAYKITDVCGSDPSAPDETIPAQTVAMPGASDLLRSNPRVLDDKASFLGERAWQIAFRPTPDIVKQLLWYNFFLRALGPSDPQMNWVLSKGELELVEKSDWQDMRATALITREARQVVQMDLSFKLDTDSSSSQYRILAQKERPADEELLYQTPEGREVSLGDPGCD